MGEVVACFLLTDLVDSSGRWERDRDGMSAALTRHDQVVGDAVVAAGGSVFKHGGDGICAVFEQPVDAARAAVALQLALVDDPVLQVRVGIHVGPAEQRDGDWFGPALNRCSRIMGLAHGGQILVSRPVAAMAKAAGDADLDVRELGSVRLRGLAEPELVHQVLAAGLPDGFPAIEGRAYDNLPVPLTSFVGRGQELADLAAVLAAHRVVTLVGVGGTGKTRLAIAAAAEDEGRPDGVLFAGLADAADGDDVARIVAEAAGLQTIAPHGDLGSPTGLIVRGLANRHALLVLDNCEHLVDPVADLVTSLVTACPGISVLTTSREPLGVPGEHVWRVPSLDEDAAVELLVDRAGSVAGSPALDAVDRAAAADLCRRLDGLPLAIELAAARLPVLSIAELSSRLDDRFRLLAGRGRRHDRHATLRATIDWSYDLLGDDERLLLDRFSVFVGGATLDAVETVCGFGATEPGSVLDVLQSLVDRSLVVAVPGQEATRFTLLETVRQYAAEKLGARGEAEELARRHAEWIELVALQAVTAATEEWSSSFAALLGEADNARAALDHSIGTGAAARAQMVGAVLAWGLMFRGAGFEGQRWCEAALAVEGEPTPATYYAECAASTCATLAGDPPGAWRHALRAVALAEADPALSELMAWQVVLMIPSEEPPPGAPDFDECVRRAQLAIDRTSPTDVQAAAQLQLSRANHLTRLGAAHCEEAEALFEQALAVLAPSALSTEYAVIWLGLARYIHRGRAGLSDAQVTAMLESPDPVVSVNMHVLAAVEAAGPGAPLRPLLDEVVERGERCCVPRHFVLDAATAMVAAAGDDERAARMYGVTRATEPWHTHAYTLAKNLRPGVEAALGADAFEALVADGARLGEEDGIALAYELADA